MGEQRLIRHRMRRREFLRRGAVAGAGIAGAAAFGCGRSAAPGGGSGASGSASRTAAAKPGGTLTLNLNDNPPSLNLWTEFTYLVARSIAPVYNQLLQVDPMDESKIIPDLAKSWEYTNADKTEIVFKLQDASITFHDGKPFTVEDVKATYDWLRSPPKGVTSQRTTAARNIDAIESPDAKTVKFRLKTPAASFTNSIASHHFPMGAKHVIDQSNTLLDAQQRPIGTGPFVFKDWKRDNVVDMERNKAYWRPNRPYLDAISAFIIQENATGVTNLLGGQLLIYGPLLTSDVARVQKEMSGKGTVTVRPSLGRLAVIPNGARPPFNDVRMREALSAALERDDLNKVIYEGRGLKGAYSVAKGAWTLPDSEIAKFSGYDGKADLQKAKQLMAAAGYPNGFKGKMPVRQDFEDRGIAVQASLKKAGFDFDVEVLKSAVFTQRVLTPDWDALTHVWATSFDDPDDSFTEMLISPDRAGRNWANITIPEVDRLFDQQRVEFDTEKRKKLVADMDKAAMAKYPNLIIVYQPQLQAQYNTVKDYVLHVSNLTNQRYENVWLAQ